MILVAQLEHLDGVESVEPSNYGIVLEVADHEALDEWLTEHERFALRDDVLEYEEELRASNKYIPFDSCHDLVRMVKPVGEENDG